MNKKIWSVLILMILIVGAVFTFASQRAIDPNVEFCLYKLFEMIGVVAISGIFIISVYLGEELKNTLIYSFGKIFLALVVFKFLYILNLEKEMVNSLKGLQALVFLNIFSKLLIIYSLIFSVVGKKKLKNVFSKASMWINIILILGSLEIFVKIKSTRSPVFLLSQNASTSLYIFSEVLIIIGVAILLYMSFKNFYFKHTKSFQIFILLFAGGEAILLIFKRNGVLFSEALQNAAMLYLFIAIFFAIALQRFRFLHNLSRFSSEVLKEKFDIQRSFELLVDFIYEIYSKTFPRICFYYQQEDENYKLVVAKDESEGIKAFEEVEVSIKQNARIKDTNHISLFDVHELKEMIECKQLKSMLSDIYRSVVFVPIRRYNKLMGFLLCYSRVKDFKMTDEEKEGLIVFMNFSQALLSQIERIEKIRNLSTEDELTGLYNRRYFVKELILESIAADRYKSKFCVAFFDMDNLKILNDFYGHAVGDKAIRMIGRIIRDNVRKTDIPARIGGDEFAVIFKDCNREAINREAIEDRIRNIKQLIERESELQLPMKIKVSCGVAVYPDDTTSLDELLKIADMRMYDEKIKSKGGDFGVPGI